ncbi:hypothetical protein HY404_02000 [Candidatus Microgenomates bacterium]|nr:hypothetical protein [Candidatus Microgenomates bacterium]
MDSSKSAVSSLPSIGALFTESWDVFAKSSLKLFILTIISLIVTFIVLIPFIIIFIDTLGLSLANLKEGGLSGISMMPPIWPVLIISLVIYFMVITAVFQIASILTVDSKGELALVSAISKSFRLVIPLFLVNLLLLFINLGGLFLLILPAILFMFLFYFAAYEVVLNNQRWTGALRRSLLIFEKHGGEILIRVLIIFLVTVGIVLILNRIAPVLSMLVNILLGWYALAYSVTLYKQASQGLENEKGASLMWVWIIAVLGWILAILFFSLIIGIISQAVRIKSLQQEMPLPSVLPLASPYATTTPILKPTSRPAATSPAI